MLIQQKLTLGAQLSDLPGTCVCHTTHIHVLETSTHTVPVYISYSTYQSETVYATLELML